MYCSLAYIVLRRTDCLQGNPSAYQHMCNSDWSCSQSSKPQYPVPEDVHAFLADMAHKAITVFEVILVHIDTGVILAIFCRQNNHPKYPVPWEIHSCLA